MSRDARVESLLVAPIPRARVPVDPRLPIAAAALLAAALVGVGLAAELSVGLALLIALCYAPLVLTNLRLGLALWVPLMFLQGVHILNLGSEAAALLIVAAWLGNLRSMRDVVVPVLRRHRHLLATVVGLILWLALSLAWADDPGLTGDNLLRWAALALLFVVVMTTVTTAESLRVVAYAFVAGAVVSVALGVIDGSLTSAVDGGARVEGGAGDPNFLASSIIAAVVLAGGLLAQTRHPVARVLLLGSVAMLVAGLVGSASRGGMLAAAVAIIATLVVFKRRRAPVVAVIAVFVGLAALTFASAPATLERVTSFDDDNGRSDLWYVAWEMGKDNPVGGVGLDNFRLHSGEYVQEPGQLEAVGNIVEEPHFVHNTYLQLFAEGGIIALALFVALVVACLRAAKQAADEFERQRNASLEILARVILVAIISMLAAAMFLSAGLDMRLWLLLALGPASLAVASRRAGELRGDGDQPAPNPRFRASVAPTLPAR